MTDHSEELKRICVAIRIADRNNRLRDDEIRSAVSKGVPADLIAEVSGLSIEQIAAIVANDVPPLLPR